MRKRQSSETREGTGPILSASVALGPMSSLDAPFCAPPQAPPPARNSAVPSLTSGRSVRTDEVDREFVERTEKEEYSGEQQQLVLDERQPF